MATAIRPSRSWTSAPASPAASCSTLPTVASGANTGSWGTYPMRSLLRTDRVLADGGSRPASIFNNVDLPDPLGPTRPMWSPSKMPNDSPSNRGAAPNALARSWPERRRSGMRGNDINVIEYAVPLTPGIDAREAAPIPPGRPAAALRAVIRTHYDTAAFRADGMAGLVVALVALPLSMALAIASGVPPQHGLYTAIVAGAVCALLGGTQFQITGPTAAFVVILLPVVRDFGVSGLLLAGLMAGVMQIGMGLARLGRLMTFIPHPVTTGFTAGIAV